VRGRVRCVNPTKLRIENARVSVRWCFPPSRRKQIHRAGPSLSVRTGSFTAKPLLIFVGCGDAEFTKEMRDGVIEIIRPDLMVEFVEAEYQPRNNMSVTNKQRSDGLAAVVSEADSYIKLSDEKENKDRSHIARTRSNCGDIV